MQVRHKDSRPGMGRELGQPCLDGPRRSGIPQLREQRSDAVTVFSTWTPNERKNRRAVVVGHYDRRSGLIIYWEALPSHAAVR